MLLLQTHKSHTLKITASTAFCQSGKPVSPVNMIGTNQTASRNCQARPAHMVKVNLSTVISRNFITHHAVIDTHFLSVDVKN